jgi:regulator of CtrA degradation
LPGADFPRRGLNLLIGSVQDAAMSGDTAAPPAVAAPTAFFSRTFDEALALTGEARDYLAQYGEEDLRGLPQEVGLHYSLETTRLTARLTNVMAWLLAQRAAHEGELSYEELRRDEWRLGGIEVCTAQPGVDVEQLPPLLADLMRRSDNLFRRIARLDEMVAGEPST